MNKGQNPVILGNKNIMYQKKQQKQETVLHFVFKHIQC
jgi:hypothetical protein